MDYEALTVELMYKIKVLERQLHKMNKRLIEEGVFDESDAIDSDDNDASEFLQSPAINNDKSNLLRQSFAVSSSQNEAPTTSKVTTDDIKKYIYSLIGSARIQGKDSITIVARDVHGALKLKSRYPMVCNAMQQCRNTGDVTISSTASGYSSTLTIKYFCH